MLGSVCLSSVQKWFFLCVYQGFHYGYLMNPLYRGWHEKSLQIISILFRILFLTVITGDTSRKLTRWPLRWTSLACDSERYTASECGSFTTMVINSACIHLIFLEAIYNSILKNTPQIKQPPPQSTVTSWRLIQWPILSTATQIICWILIGFTFSSWIIFP